MIGRSHLLAAIAGMVAAESARGAGTIAHLSQPALAAMPKNLTAYSWAYSSRGKGYGRPPRNFHQRTGKLPDSGAEGKAAARRRRQIAAGILTASNGLVR